MRNTEIQETRVLGDALAKVAALLLPRSCGARSGCAATTDTNKKLLAEFADRNRLLTSGHYPGFQDRTVMLVRATADQLAQSLDSLDDLAELRRPHE